MRIKIKYIRNLMINVLLRYEVDRTTASFIVDDYIEAELLGKKTHGLCNFLLIDSSIKNKESFPEIICENQNSIIVDAHKSLSHIASRLCILRMIELSKNSAIVIGVVRNASRYNRLTPYGKMIANAGMVGIICNNGGPSSVVPYGTTTPLFGTNPLCIAIPHDGSPIIIDLSTAMKPWGKVRECLLLNTTLPPNTFMDKKGEFTTVPDQADSVIPFGDVKGSAICFAIELLTGAVIGSRMGKSVRDQYDCGYLFISINPTFFTSIEKMENDIDALLADYDNACTISPNMNARIPSTYQLINDEMEIEIDNKIYNAILKMSKS